MSEQQSAGGLEAVRDLYPEVHAAIEAMEDFALVSSDPHLHDLASSRVAELLRGERPTGAALPPPTPFDNVVRDFVDQFVCDVARVTDDQVLGLLEWMSPKKVFELVNVLYVIDATERLRIALGCVVAGGQ